MLKRMAAVPNVDARDLSSIEVIIQGAAPMPPGLVHRWADLVGADRLIMSYGMSEGLGITAIRADEWMQRQGSVGRPARDSQIRVLDTDGNATAPGEVGDVYLRSPAYGGSTYLGGSQPTMTADGFCTVGDLGYLDEDGFLYLVDRRSDLNHQWRRKHLSRRGGNRAARSPEHQRRRRGRRSRRGVGSSRARESSSPRTPLIRPPSTT